MERFICTKNALKVEYTLVRSPKKSLQVGIYYVIFTDWGIKKATQIALSLNCY